MKYDPSRPTIGVDVDLTTLQSDKAWWQWLWNMTSGHNLPPSIDDYVKEGNLLDYDLSSHFPRLDNDNVDPFDFWRQEGVYDWIEPIDGAVPAIKKLMEYANIVFVTHNKGNGGRSKFNNLARLFGKDNFSYVVTREKFLVKMDYMIDDRNDFLNDCAQNGIRCIRLITPHKQYEDQHSKIIPLENWHEIQHYMINTLEHECRMAS